MSGERESLFDALMQEAAAAGINGQTVVEPHDFRELHRWRNRGRCRTCLIHEDHHPCPGWMPARPLYDDREAIRLV